MWKPDDYHWLYRVAGTGPARAHLGLGLGVVGRTGRLDCPKAFGAAQDEHISDECSSPQIQWECNVARLGDWIDHYLVWVSPVIEQLKIESDQEN